MSTIFTNWNKKELEAYMLIFCADADFVETEEEQKIILSHIDQTLYKKMIVEFNLDNDFERMQKIMSTFTRLDLNGDDRQSLIQDLKAQLLSDGHLHPIAHNLEMLLKRLV